MKCIICNMPFKKGVNYRNKPICDECLLHLMFILVDKYKDSFKRYLNQEIRLEFFE